MDVCFFLMHPNAMERSYGFGVIWKYIFLISKLAFFFNLFCTSREFWKYIILFDCLFDFSGKVCEEFGA
jgi:hypothetical protein